ncbi:hypothetical protein CU098_012406 [Rhizopus stolonifer]|uniref:Uncharacterized protein n=1 Tax=Rhizopus stolonifer TaxID=4846 RepID=A0A367KQ21_RHIST|nr:hypothetical protein CU098_012406 [Rhizopus stolonifer]
MSYLEVYRIRSVCRKFQIMGEFHIYQQVKTFGQTITLELDGNKTKTMDLVASHYDPRNRVIEFVPASFSSLSLANTSSHGWSVYHRLMKIHFSGWFSNKTQAPSCEKLSPQDQAMFLYHYQYNSSIEKTYELPSWSQVPETDTADDCRYLGDKSLILAMSYHQSDKNALENHIKAPNLTSLPTSYYSYRSIASTAPVPAAPRMDVQWVRVTLDWILSGMDSAISTCQIYEQDFAKLNQMLAKEGCFKYDPLSEPILGHIVHQQCQETQQLPKSLVNYVHTHSHECHTRLSRLQHMLEGAGVDPQVLWKYTFAKSFVVGNGSLLGEEDVVRRIQDSEEEWCRKKSSLYRRLFNTPIIHHSIAI